MFFKKQETPWCTTKEFTKKYSNREFLHNRILGENVLLNIDVHTTLRNNNVFCVGHNDQLEEIMLANILQANSNYVVQWYNANFYHATKDFLESQGYAVYLIDLDILRVGDYNPFEYLPVETSTTHEALLFQIAHTLLRDDSEELAKKMDAYLMFCLLYHIWEQPAEKRNFYTLYQFLETATPETVHELCAGKGLLYERAYAMWSATGGQEESIARCKAAIGFGVFGQCGRLMHNSVNLRDLNTDKCAIFIQYSGNIVTRPLVNLFYTQLYNIFETRPWGITNYVSVMSDFPVYGLAEKLAELRKQGVSVILPYKNLTLLKRQYPKDWEAVFGNCDSFVFMSSKDFNTLEYFSKEIGVMPIKQTFKPRRSSINYCIQPRMLMEPFELEVLPEEDVIIKVRGVKPIKTKAFALTKHPNYPKLRV